MKKERIYGERVNKNEGVKYFCDEDCRENEEKKEEWNNPFKVYGLGF